MASKQKKKPGRTEAAYRGSTRDRRANVKEFLRRAPQFTTLTNSVEGRERELSRSQQEFLDDFATKLVEGAVESDDAS